MIYRLSIYDWAEEEHSAYGKIQSLTTNEEEWQHGASRGGWRCRRLNDRGG